MIVAQLQRLALKDRRVADKSQALAAQYQRWLVRSARKKNASREARHLLDASVTTSVVQPKRLITS
jgi:hypothetical protein